MPHTGPAPASDSPASPPPLTGPASPPTVALTYARGAWQNPWLRRKKFGAFLAFWATVAWVFRHNGQLSSAMDEPVPWRDARKFRRWCVFHGMLPMLLFVAALGLQVVDAIRSIRLWSLLPLMAGAVFVAWIGLACLAGATSWFFCPKSFDTDRQNRAIAMSCYLCAPLAILGVLGAALVLGILVSSQGPPAIVPLLLMGALWVYWWQLVLFGARSIARRSGKGMFVTALALPAVWAAIAVMATLAGWDVMMWPLMVLSLT